MRLLEPGEVPEFARKLNAIPVSFTEFALAARDYPLVFTSADGGKSFAPVAVLGMGAGENLFVDAAGGWAPKLYVPAYARRFPFCMAKVTLNQVEQQNRMVCVEKSRLDEGGEAMFDAQGEPSAKWRDMQRLPRNTKRTWSARGNLLDPGRLRAAGALQPAGETGQGRPVQLAGMHRIDEKKIEHLNIGQFKTLAKKGILGRLYAHLLSLENFARLLERRAARAAA